ncbi:MAG: UDP-N-acetylglucosamine--peptide N-acetylglucosaminyltransferase kDa subunit-like isoform, partial [Pseudobdellovibrio sp.]|nr:UDP-N-acetylglucosamine--peptide N-acetylglucosaminyltransferase kDa subunit-like isoform [Pseudobdellovibrio sp.]
LTKIKKPWLTGAVAGYILVFAVMGWSYKEAWAENKTLFQRVLSVNSKSFMAYNNLGLVAAREGQAQEAVKFYEAAFKIKPEFSQPLLNLFSLQTKARNFDYLKELSAKIDFAKMNDHQLYFEYASYLQANRQLAESEAAYLKAIELRPGEALYYFRLAAVNLAQNQIENAKVNFQRAAELEPANKTYVQMFEQIKKL